MYLTILRINAQTHPDRRTIEGRTQVRQRSDDEIGTGEFPGRGGSLDGQHRAAGRPRRRDPRGGVLEDEAARRFDAEPSRREEEGFRIGFRPGDVVSGHEHPGNPDPRRGQVRQLFLRDWHAYAPSTAIYETAAGRIELRLRDAGDIKAWHASRDRRKTGLHSNMLLARRSSMDTKSSKPGFSRRSSTSRQVVLMVERSRPKHCATTGTGSDNPTWQT